MEQNLCPCHEICPFYSGKYKDIDNMHIFREIYCRGGLEGRNRCKRYKVFQIKHRCPENIFPNSVDSLEEIISNMNN